VIVVDLVERQNVVVVQMGLGKYHIAVSVEHQTMVVAVPVDQQRVDDGQMVVAADLGETDCQVQLDHQNRVAVAREEEVVRQRIVDCH
jgi:hypothetical protein